MDREELKYNGEEPLDNLKHDKFCIEYVRSYGMRVDSYCIAYGLDKKNKQHYKSASASASRLLENVNILIRISYLTDINCELNDDFVDLNLKKVIMQDEDKGAKTKGIDIYNRMMKRYDEKIQLVIEEYKAKFD